MQALPGNRPALLVVDDLPQLDTLSALLLSQLVEGGVVTLLATARSGMPLPDAQVGLWSGDGFLRIDLEPFGPHETVASLAKALDAQSPLAPRPGSIRSAGGYRCTCANSSSRRSGRGRSRPWTASGA